ncbi:hypothetical protein BC939DRAFT_139653 [Gamsiella multidivaricata]|uniref:uncharacterized protein n=1 Tax=Gamsiella multidivaricata TaxID=101098 RepID=UPI00221E6F50|nr:uncharacterized protein BC939DRAFT_139653 [Gamsiella multidivaricata]KAG0371406.1 hypothetical protein BGZ54_000033 [Gamsiella multidivaricata]KAI7824704.1 hypothetical protein BC939DRAFT_139653 [Gamsiella multidivaricata]
MGRPVGRNLEDELMTKIKTLFDRILDTVNKENPAYAFDFEQFVDCFDENDHFTKRVFEFLVKETAQRYRSVHPNAQNSAHSRPHTIHHYFGQDSGNSNISSSGSTTNSNINDAVNSTNDSTSNDNDNDNGTDQSPNRHHFHHHSQRPSSFSQHTLPALERDSIARSPSNLAGSPGGPNEGASSSSSSGAALRYLLSSQGFGQGGTTRRARIAQRILSSDLFAYHQGQPSLMSTMGSLSNPASSTETTTSQNRSGQNRISQELERTSTSGSVIAADAANTSGGPSSSSPSSTAGTGSGPTLRRSWRRGETLERQRAFIYRPLSRANDTSTSMENVPDSFHTDGWSSASPGASFTSEIFDPTSGELYGARPASPDRRPGHVGIDQARQMQEQYRQAQDLRQQQIRQLYIQTLQSRGRQRHHSLAQLEQHRQTLRALQGERIRSSEDTQQQDQQQQQPRYQLHDNGLMLVQYYPTSPSTPTPASDAPEGNTNRDASSSSNLTSQMPLSERYHEFSDSTQRGRAAMRNALTSELHIEEDHQVLQTGEVSRRRRRRLVGRFSNPTGSPDIASDNSSAIISQSQLQQGRTQEQGLGQVTALIPAQGQGSLEQIAAPVLELTVNNASGFSGQPQDQSDDRQQTVDNPLDIQNSSDSTRSPSIGDRRATSTVSAPVLTPVLELAEGEVTRTADDNVPDVVPDISGSADTHGQGLSVDGHQPRSVPPTPPSPNPNRNPMPTFTDRRRSSINPADIEAVVRRMRANVESATIAQRASRSSHLVLSSRNGMSIHSSALASTAPGFTMAMRRTSAEPAHEQPLPSPPQTDPEAGAVSGGTHSSSGSPAIQ